MPPRKKAASDASAEPERRSTRIRDAPPKPKPAAAPAAAAAAAKKVKKTDPELAEWRPSKKAAPKKRKKADVDVEDKEDGEGKAADDEEKPKKKSKTEPKESKDKKAADQKTDNDAAAAKASTTARTERRKSGVVTVQPAISEGDEGKVEEDVLTIGSAMPSVTLQNERGEDVETATLYKETGVVIFAAPKADTPGCNKQACHFRDSTDDFKKLGYSVYALTHDTPAALAKWQSKNNLPYSLLSDPTREFIKAIGAKSGATTKRSHFIFEKGTGKLLVASIGVKPDASHASALKAIEAL